MTTTFKRRRVGELRPSQLLFTFGVGSIIDLPNLSVMVMGLDDWEPSRSVEIGEERLLMAVQSLLGQQVAKLLAPPIPPEESRSFMGQFDETATVGVPVAVFPRWLLCPSCRLLAPISSGLFELRVDLFRPERNKYIHTNCSHARIPPTVVPARFLVACEDGHLDDFPWTQFVHRGPTDCRARLRLRELGASGEAADVEVLCETCKKSRRMADAFGAEGRANMGRCGGRRPHLKDAAENGCERQMEAILLGASNSWFPLTLSALSIPTAVDRLDQLVQEHWSILEKITSRDIVKFARETGQLRAFTQYNDDKIWEAIERKRSQSGDTEAQAETLKTPEWQVFSTPDFSLNSTDFQLTPVEPPSRYSSLIEQVVLVERIREVRALVGFTRIESPNDYGGVVHMASERRAPLSRSNPRWVPASEVRGEGIFVKFAENGIANWAASVAPLDAEFLEAHCQWRTARNLMPPEARYPGVRFVLLHSFAHALMRQLSLECGYTAASIRERIYSASPSQDDGPMAGVLLYTAAPDSEGTLGGLVSLGEPHVLGRLINQALGDMELCASDPLCSEHDPVQGGLTLHAAACHACLFAPETSCESGNKYLDRSVLVKTFNRKDASFFS